ncbi:unnamed protein product, partial [Rotaria sordida]
DNEQIWIIKMQLAEDDNHALKKLFNQLKADYGGGENETNLQSFGDVLQHMGKYDSAEKIYSDLRKTYSPDDTSFSHLCFSFGMLYKERKDYDRSLQWFQRALDRKIRTEPSDFVYIGGLYCCIGNIHMEKNGYNEAIKCYNTAMDYYKCANATNHPYVASLYHGIARICYAQKQYSDALDYYQRSLAIQQEHLPSNHPDMAINHTGIGDVYRSVGKMKSLPPQHQDIGSSYKSIGLLYETMNNLKEALEYYKKAESIYRQSLSAQHSNVVEIAKDIQRVISKLK